jgi:DNA adenine methylase
MKPIFKWVGGKRWYAQEASNHIRKHLTGIYYEPFLGSGAVFFTLNPKQAVLCDAVEGLISTYANIKRDPMAVWRWMKAVGEESNSQEHYLLQRQRFNELLMNGTYDDEFSGLFIYLNKTGYNGLWRQNSEGGFNVPFGDYDKIKLPTVSDLIQTADHLNGASLVCSTSSTHTFNIINQATEGDVIFADPPYLNLFNDYDGLFVTGKEFHEKLSIKLWQAVTRGVVVLVMNTDCEETRKWYGAFAEIETFNRAQSIAGTVEGRKRWNQLLAVGIP